MKFKEVEISSVNPFKSDEERDGFAKLFPHFCDYATRVTKSGDVLEEDDIVAHTFFTPAYFLGWKWHFDIAINALRGWGYPEREFVDFVFDMSTRLGIYLPPKEKMMEEFEQEMGKVWKHPDTFKRSLSSGEYLSNLTHGAFEAWYAAKKNFHYVVRKVEQG
jgi:hypothetical protein